MICDPETLLCTIPAGSLALALSLAVAGIIITLYDLIAGIIDWWINRG
jgi:hypothetical protein